MAMKRTKEDGTEQDIHDFMRSMLGELFRDKDTSKTVRNMKGQLDNKPSPNETSNQQKKPSTGPSMFNVMDKAPDSKKRANVTTPSRQPSSAQRLKEFLDGYEKDEA